LDFPLNFKQPLLAVADSDSGVGTGKHSPKVTTVGNVTMETDEAWIAELVQLIMYC
jgi:hypothetical protein